MNELVSFQYENIHLKGACWIKGKPYFTRRGIGEWLEYTHPTQAVTKIIERNPHIKEFSTVVKLTTVDGKERRVEVYDPIGFQLIVMESRQPKSIQYKIAVAHLVTAYASGQLIGSPGFSENITQFKDIMDKFMESVNQRFQALESRPPIHINLPDDAALPMSLERSKSRRRMHKAIRDLEIGQFLAFILPQGLTHKEATQAVKEKWPDNPEKWVTKSSVGRFWKSACDGRLKEFGIDPRKD